MTSLPLLRYSDPFMELLKQIRPREPMDSHGFQRGWLKNPDGSQGEAVLVGGCGKDCRFGKDCKGCPGYLSALEKEEETGVERLVEFFYDQLLVPFLWRKETNAFICPEGDLFHKSAEDELIYRMFAVAVSLPWHRFILATKRAEGAERIMTDENFPKKVREVGRAFLGSRYKEPEAFGSNIIMAVSVGLTEYLDRTKFLAGLPKAMTKAIFIAPMVESFPDVFQHVNPKHVGWVMCAGERASQYCTPRPCKDVWYRDVRDQVKKHSIPLFILRRYTPQFIDLMGGRRYWEFPEVLRVKEPGLWLVDPD